MPYLSKYHISEQYAHALLEPVTATLRELEARTRHYVDRVNLSAADQESMRKAHEAIATARQEVERQRMAGRPAREG